MKQSFKRKKGPVQSRKIPYDGITFASGLERYMYMALKKLKSKLCMKEKHLNFKKHLIFHLNRLSVVEMVKEIIKIEEIKKFLILNILLIL